MATLYVIEQGAQVEKEYRRIIVTRDDETLLATPQSRIDEVVLLGRVGVTTPALHALLAADISLTLLNRWGKLLGRLQPATGKNIALRQQQYARARDPDFCLAFSRQIVQGKLRNVRNFARRLARTRTTINPHHIERIDAALAACATAHDMASLRGREGAGARAYFGILRQSLEAALPFERRTRRPPRDPVNALLSLGYSLLVQNLMTACEVVGLDPYDGFYHADHYGRPALALDLMEEFRTLIVDSVVLNLVNRGRLGPDDFEPGENGGVYLSGQGLRTFFSAYTTRLQTEVQHPLAPGRRLSYQKIFEVQARQLRKVIEGESPAYEPFLTR